MGCMRLLHARVIGREVTIAIAMVSVQGPPKNNYLNKLPGGPGRKHDHAQLPGRVSENIPDSFRFRAPSSWQVKSCRHRHRIHVTTILSCCTKHTLAQESTLFYSCPQSCSFAYKRHPLSIEKSSLVVRFFFVTRDCRTLSTKKKSHQIIMTQIIMLSLLLFVLLLMAATAAGSSSSTPSPNSNNLRFASPLQCLTIWEEKQKVDATTPRSRFLKKFKAGLEAEVETRKALKARNEQALLKLEEKEGDTHDWAKKAATLERRQRREEDLLVEEAYDEAIKSFITSHQQKQDALQKTTRSNPNKYQFVGVINNNSDAASSTKNPITWYARKKPPKATWSLRLIHVNRDAIIKDLFTRGKVDILACYKNTGELDKETNQCIVKTEYIVKERSWRQVCVVGGGGVVPLIVC